MRVEKSSKEVFLINNEYFEILTHLFTSVNRLHCKGVTYELDLVVGQTLTTNIKSLNIYSIYFVLIDVNSELFDVRAGDRIGVVLTRYANPTF